MTPEEKPFDTSRIPVFYQNGSVKVGDKEYAPGEYPLGTDTMTDVDTSSEAINRFADRWDAVFDTSEFPNLLRALAAERDELERLAGDMEKALRSPMGDVQRTKEGLAFLAYQRKRKGE